MEVKLEKIYVENRLPGYFFIGDFEVLTEIIGNLPNNGTIVQIGTYLGRTAKFFADISQIAGKNFNIVCLDTYKNKSSEIFADHLNNRFAGEISSVKSFLHNQYTNLEMVQESLKDYNNIQCFEYDLFVNDPKELQLSNIVCVFDDAVHNKEGVTKCFNDWFPLLDNGGIYCGHDYSENFLEVQTAVNLIAKEHNLTLKTPRKDSSMYYFKKI